MKFTIPVTWTMSAKIEIEASNLEEALEKANNCALPENGTYLEDSFCLDTESIDCALD